MKSTISAHKIKVCCILLVLSFKLVAQSSSTMPEARVAATLIYHEQLHKVLLLDGLMREPIQEQTKIWAWDGKKWEMISDKGPLSRALGKVAYDSKRNRVIMRGGRSWPGDKQVKKDDTWEWDGKNWKQFGDTILGVPYRDHFMMVYDKKKSVTVLAGGAGLNKDESDFIWPADTWNWDGKTWNKVERSQFTGHLAAMIYDSKRDEIVSISVTNNQDQQYAHTWILKEGEWIKSTTEDSPLLQAPAMTFDSDKGVVLLYGASKDNRQLGNMWQWDGKRWAKIETRGSTPGNRGGVAIEYDPVRKKTVLFGGYNESGKLNDTWEWNGTTWEQK